LGVAIIVAVLLVLDPSRMSLFPLIVVIPLIFGVMMIVPIGGADMPTVISLLNSYRDCPRPRWDLFWIANCLLSRAHWMRFRFILSVNMSKAMNRSFTNVLFGAFGQEQTAVAGKAELDRCEVQHRKKLRRFLQRQIK